MVLTYDAYQETIDEQKKKESRVEELELQVKNQAAAQAVHQKLLETIVGMLQNVNRPEMHGQNNDLLNIPEFKTLTHEQKLEGLKEIREETQTAINEVLIPETANLVHGLSENNRKKVKDSAKKMLDDKRCKQAFVE